MGPGHYSTSSAFYRKSTVPSLINFGFSKSPKKTYLDDIMQKSRQMPDCALYSPENADTRISKKTPRTNPNWFK